MVRNPIIALIVGAVIVAMVAAVLAGIAVVRAVRFLRSRAAARPVSTRVREPNLLVEFVKAKKQKACPLIEVVD